MLFDAPHDDLSDQEVAEILRQSIAGAGRLSRLEELHFTAICAEHLVDGLRAAGLRVIRLHPPRLHE